MSKRCYGCNILINGISVRHPLWVNDFICLKCAKDSKRCIICERPVNKTGNKFQIVGERCLRETFYQCPICESTGSARSFNDLKELVVEALKYYRDVLNIDLKHSMNICYSDVVLNNGLPTANIALSPIHDLNLSITSTCVKESTWSEFLVFGKFIPLKNSAEIKIAKNIQRDVAFMTIIHELFHAYLYFKGKKMNINIEETLCNAVMLKSLNYNAMNIPKNNVSKSFLSFPATNYTQEMLRKEIREFRYKRALANLSESESRLIKNALNLFPDKWERLCCV